MKTCTPRVKHPILWFAGWMLLLSAISIPAFADGLTDPQQQDYSSLFSENRLAPARLIERLAQAFQESEYVAVILGTRSLDGHEGVPVRVAWWNDDAKKGASPNICSSLVSPKSQWDLLANLALLRMDDLAQSNLGAFDSDKTPAVAILVFHLPHERFLDVGSVHIRLSKQTQRHLVVAAQSDYPSSRKVMIVSEPHFEVGEQLGLFKGLETLFAENPSLSQGGRSVFLAEGYPAHKPLSVHPLVQARSTPDERLVRSVLATFLIPGYVAVEWKHQWGIPIVGTEDPVLYRSSARLWCELQDNQSPERAALWSATVGARNATIVRTLLTQLNLHECPFLFVGGKHLEPQALPRGLDTATWDGSKGSVSVGEVGRLYSAGLSGIAERLRERSIGFYFLTAKGPAVKDGKKEAENLGRYQALFRAQLTGQLDSYVGRMTAHREGVTVAPNPEAAAQFVAAAAAGNGSSGESSSDGEDKEVGKDDGKKDPNGGGPLGQLIKNIKNGLGKGKAKRNRDGDLPAQGKPNSSSVTDQGNGKGTIRDYGVDGKAQTDYDFGHNHGSGDPHTHDWDWSKEPARQPGRPLKPGE